MDILTLAVAKTHAKKLHANSAANLNSHNKSGSAHSDIRALIQGLTTRLNTIANSDDTTLDQLAELVAYIKSNKSLIDQITTNKVSVVDIVDNLDTDVSNKPLSAAQGVALKALIDAITIPTDISSFNNDSGYLTEHQDISGKLDKNQGSANVGKILMVGDDGNVILGDPSAILG